ncbi:hypothetical protein J9885_05110 [Aeromonas sp. SrichE-2G]|uniref:hypothetical protein n=1 Tax=Aeromonas sp. SrichE-2G TaxID=2823359 RepID=UPI001B31CD18|nr:hypothetical protein [Aeromonas sp. SrichE-2G]MBP4040651.1 hypothetical protein [Aeromonas sp. SrichE-2G]
MTEIYLLLVEDDEQDRNSCLSAATDFGEDFECKINISTCKDIDEALTALSNSFYDGAIIDMKLAKVGNEGNQVIRQIRDSLKRIPVVIMTGTPDVAETDNFPLVNIYKKGEKTYYDIIKELYGIYLTGLTKIMGGKGEIEKFLSRIFIDNLLPQRGSWSIYGIDNQERTEKALLRHALNHLTLLLDNDVDKCYPEEMYIYPPTSTRINTGCILKNKSLDKYFIVMNPACDLAERNGGGCNTDRALLVEIQNITDIFPSFNFTDLSKSNKNELDKIYKNNKSGYYHWLPTVVFFNGGVINFRMITTHSEAELSSQYDKPLIQISPAFVKDIVSRFSSYYARQGQPDIDHEKGTLAKINQKAEAQ